MARRVLSRQTQRGWSERTREHERFSTVHRVRCYDHSVLGEGPEAVPSAPLPPPSTALSIVVSCPSRPDDGRSQHGVEGLEAAPKTLGSPSLQGSTRPAAPRAPPPARTVHRVGPCSMSLCAVAAAPRRTFSTLSVPGKHPPSRSRSFYARRGKKLHLHDTQHDKHPESTGNSFFASPDPGLTQAPQMC